jgi:hypothetical protein
MARRQRAYVHPTWEGSHRLIIIEDTEPGRIRIADGFVWRDGHEGDCFDPQEGILADDLIQNIVNAAWERGFRPHGFSDVKNETTAIRSHLDDMRAIAFHKLGMKPKP